MAESAFENFAPYSTSPFSTMCQFPYNKKVYKISTIIQKAKQIVFYKEFKFKMFMCLRRCRTYHLRHVFRRFVTPDIVGDTNSDNFFIDEVTRDELSSRMIKKNTKIKVKYGRLKTGEKTDLPTSKLSQGWTTPFFSILL